MAKAKKTKVISVELPDQQHLNYITQALSVVNHYRMLQKQPIHSIETFALNTVLDGARSVHEFYQKQAAKAKAEEEAASASEATNKESSTDTSTGLGSGTADTTAQTEPQNSTGVDEGTEKES